MKFYVLRVTIYIGGSVMPLLHGHKFNTNVTVAPSMEPDSADFWWHIIIASCLILLGGIFAGLTLGLMGLDELHLRVLATSSDDPIEKRNAQKGALSSNMNAT